MSKVIFNGIELNGTQALPELTYAEYDALSVKPEYWILKDDALSEDYVEVTADGSKTYSALLDELYALVDTNRLNEKSCFVTDKYSIPITYTSSNTFRAIGMMLADTSMVYVNGYYCVASGSKLYSWTLKTSGNTITDNSNGVPTSGTIFRLYYNTATLGQINTKAENCIYGNGNVKDALDALGTASTQAVANNLTTSAAGSVLDARQGKTLDDSRKAFIVGKKVTVNATVAGQSDQAVTCTVPTGYIPLCVLGSSYMNDQGYMGAPSYVTSGTTKARWKNLNNISVTLTNQVCVFYFVKDEITVS